MSFACCSNICTATELVAWVDAEPHLAIVRETGRLPGADGKKQSKSGYFAEHPNRAKEFRKSLDVAIEVMRAKFCRIFGRSCIVNHVVVQIREYLCKLEENGAAASAATTTPAKSVTDAAAAAAATNTLSADVEKEADGVLSPQRVHGKTGAQSIPLYPGAHIRYQNKVVH